MSVIIPIVSKNVKPFNDLNQIVKKCFNIYFIFRNGLICSPTGEYVKGINKGTHIAFCESLVKEIYAFIESHYRIEEGKFISFISDQLFTALKEKKKLLESIKIEDNVISIFRDKEEFTVGYIANVDEVDLESGQLLAKHIMRNDHISMNFSIEGLLNNELVTITKDDCKARMTKELIPVLKKDSNIYYNIMNGSKDRFKLLIICESKGVRLLHVYTCVKY